MSSIFKIGIIFAALLNYNVLTSYYEPPPKEKVIIGHHGKNGGQFGEIHPFKFSTEYDVNKSMKSLNERKLDYVKSVVEEALLPFANLKIRQEPFIFLNHTCDEHRIGGQVKCESNCNVTKCGSMEIPAKYLGSCMVDDTIKIEEGVGANAHFLLFVSLGEIVKNCDKDDVFSIAAHCQQGVMDRPVAGYLDICPDKVIDTKLRSRVVKELTHDILHILAFSQSLYPFYHDSNGNPRTPRNKETNLPPMDDSSFFIAGESTIGKVSRDWKISYKVVKREVKMLVTETVANKAKEHFGCYDLEGADLEDGGGVRGFEMAHFEKRLFKNEIMTGTHNEVDEEYVFSALTLAVLQDSGWYIVNFGNAEPLAYAQGVGCKFVRTSCLEWVRTRCPKCFNPYCEELKNIPAYKDIFYLNSTCSPNRKSILKCEIISYPNVLDRIFHYFHIDDLYGYNTEHYLNEYDNANKLGGSDALFDYCPIYRHHKWELEPSGFARLKCADDSLKDKPHNLWHEIYGEKTICFDFVKKWAVTKCYQREYDISFIAGCYKYKCHKNMLYVAAKKGNIMKYYLCAKKGQLIHLTRKFDDYVGSGHIVCPDCSELCNDCVPKNFNSLDEFKIFENKTGDPLEYLDPCGTDTEDAIESDEATSYSNVKFFCSYTSHFKFLYSLVLVLTMLL